MDYLFGYDATANVVDDWMYEKEVAETYALDKAMQQFSEESNPWALQSHCRKDCWKQYKGNCGKILPKKHCRN
ncbi:cobaltochelatase subunit CobN [Paucibacter sp. O1-1]|nr:cobaltochelatase subunit CobN [Paucibacter sp. O1-1]MDA3825986.1 cobaltochelatase subunit CobN [Paucibacter sp. O1-1]